jgi:hypothetical protein
MYRYFPVTLFPSSLSLPCPMSVAYRPVITQLSVEPAIAWQVLFSLGDTFINHPNSCTLTIATGVYLRAVLPRSCLRYPIHPLATSFVPCSSLRPPQPNPTPPQAASFVRLLPRLSCSRHPVCALAQLLAFLLALHPVHTSPHSCALVTATCALSTSHLRALLTVCTPPRPRHYPFALSLTHSSVHRLICAPSQFAPPQIPVSYLNITYPWGLCPCPQCVPSMLWSHFLV